MNGVANHGEARWSEDGSSLSFSREPQDSFSRLLVRFIWCEDDPLGLEFDDLLPCKTQFLKHFFGMLTQKRCCPTDNA
jgi:hypothetical protein